MEDNNTTANYWPSVFIGALLVAIVTFIISLISGYLTIHSQPTGQMFGPSQLIGTFSCLLGVFGGLVATYHYAKTNNITYTIGKGALIGLITGVVAAVIVTLLTQLWQVVDPAYAQNIIDATVANFEAMPNIPEEQKQQMIEMTAEKLASQYNSLSGILMGAGISILTFGLLNLLSGMVGAKVFAAEKSDL